MYYTIDEAKTKKCCTYRGTTFSDKCTATDCMAWRREKTYQKVENTSVNNSTRNPNNIKPDKMIPIYTGRGYYGLAGTPV